MEVLSIAGYSEISFAVRGDTRTHQDALKKLGGRWNPNLQGGPGYIFGMKRLNDVQNFVANVNAGVILTNPVAARPTRAAYTPMLNTQFGVAPMMNTPLVTAPLPGAQLQPLVSLPTVKKTQTLTYEVAFPVLGNKVIIEIEGNRLDTIIHQIHKNDKIVLRYPAVDPPMFFEAGVYAGEWKVPVDQRPHKLIFE